MLNDLIPTCDQSKTIVGARFIEPVKGAMNCAPKRHECSQMGLEKSAGLIATGWLMITPGNTRGLWHLWQIKAESRQTPA
jgi:hypothetical protein